MYSSLTGNLAVMTFATDVFPSIPLNPEFLSGTVPPGWFCIVVMVLVAVTKLSYVEPC